MTEQDAGATGAVPSYQDYLDRDSRPLPLEQCLEVLPRHFERWRLEDCWKAVHVAKVIRCNWKVAQEAFTESYHVIATHPQILSIIADASSQYHVFGAHVSRNLAAFGAPSPHLGGGKVDPQQTLDGMLQLMGRRPGALGTIDADAARWRPHGRDVGSCVMEVMILKRSPRGQPRPPPVGVHWLRDDQPWTDATELPILGAVIDQDMSNMPFVQEGLLASATGRVQLGEYQEVRIRHLHQTLGRYLADPSQAV